MADTNDAPNDPGAAPKNDSAPKNDADKAAPPSPAPETPDWESQAKRWEKQSKNDAAALAALKKRMQGLLTPEQVQDAQQAAQTASQEATAAKHEALKLRVALEQGLPADMADRLIGDDREALEEDAKKLKAFVVQPPKSRVPDAGAGTGKTPQQTTQDPNALLRTAMGIG